jgi:hypothetical protein
VWAAPLGPGRVCLVGSFAQRAWVGEATFDPAAGAAAVTVYFEAKEAPDWGNREQWKRVEVGFRPGLVATLQGPPGPDGKPARRVVVVRAAREHPTLKDYPLVVDPDKRTVEVLHQPLAGGTPNGLYASLCACAGGRMFYIRLGRLGKNPRPGELVELTLPGPAERVVVGDAPNGQGPHTAIVAHEGKVHFVMEHLREHRPVKPPEGKSPTPTVSPGQTLDAAYWVLDPERHTSELVASRVPGLRALYSSSHYGLVAVVITDLHSPSFVWTLNAVEIERRPPK